MEEADHADFLRFDDFDQFINYLGDPAHQGPIISPSRFCRALEFDQLMLAGLARVHRNTVGRAPESAGIQRFLRDSVRIIRAATDVSGDVGRALFWYRNEPLSAFGYQTADQLVSQGRTDDLLRYVASIEAGAAG
ncbi:MAG: DUF2384 domain-containing protein [Thermomicrobiales bacterium]|nr:MAG: DUF2384 domain-containing protein [Thermomicrobiales bacterium]